MAYYFLGRESTIGLKPAKIRRANGETGLTRPSLAEQGFLYFFKEQFYHKSLFARGDYFFERTLVMSKISVRALLLAATVASFIGCNKTPNTEPESPPQAPLPSIN